MTDTILKHVEGFVAKTGLSEHRVGIILAKNGRLIGRLRDGRRIWPETEKFVREGLVREYQARGHPVPKALTPPNKGAAD